MYGPCTAAQLQACGAVGVYGTQHGDRCHGCMRGWAQVLGGHGAVVVLCAGAACQHGSSPENLTAQASHLTPEHCWLAQNQCEQHGCPGDQGMALNRNGRDVQVPCASAHHNVPSSCKQYMGVLSYGMKAWKTIWIACSVPRLLFATANSARTAQGSTNWWQELPRSCLRSKYRHSMLDSLSEGC